MMVQAKPPPQAKTTTPATMPKAPAAQLAPKRLSSHQPATNQIQVNTSQTLATISGNADNQFRVFDNGVEVAISSVVRHPSDATAVLITLAAATSGTVTVSYGNVVASGTGVTLSNAVKNAAGLPLPQFAVQTAVP
jgi:hypothetical protein